MATRCLLVLLLVSSVAQAMQTGAPDSSPSGSQSAPQATCPWLTVGSAARALGGDVDVAMTGANAEAGTCRFLRRDAAMDSLEIAVSKDPLPICPAGSRKLVGIGNEAAQCKLTAAHGEMAEMVSGRVRELHFTLILHGQKRDAKASDPQDDALGWLAEQVAGNLF